MKNYKSIICVVAAVCLLGTAAFCGFRIYHYYAEVDEQTEAFEEIAEMVEQAPTDEKRRQQMCKRDENDKFAHW